MKHKKLLDTVKGKLKKPINEDKLKKLASNVSSSDLKDEAKIKNLIDQVAKIANVTITEEKKKEIVQYIKNNNITPANIGQLLAHFNKK